MFVIFNCIYSFYYSTLSFSYLLRVYNYYAHIQVDTREWDNIVYLSIKSYIMSSNSPFVAIPLIFLSLTLNFVLKINCVIALAVTTWSFCSTYSLISPPVALSPLWPDLGLEKYPRVSSTYITFLKKSIIIHLSKHRSKVLFKLDHRLSR